MKKRSFLRSMMYAKTGIIHFIKSEPNSRLHILATIVAISAGIWFKIDRFSWVALVLCIGLVWSAEMFNTAIEKIMNMISPEKNDQVRIIKDMAAGAVLIAAIISLITGIIIFYPHILQLFM